MSQKSPLERLAAIFDTIRNTALEVHERFELDGINPLLEFERCILGNGRRFDDSTRATTLWALLLFSQPRLASQLKFQNAVNAKLPNAEASLIVRLLSCSAPRAWSFRHSYQRGFAHTLAGPNAHSEISVDGCISSWGAIQNDDHLYLIGWTLTFNDHIFLICADELSQKQVYTIEKLKPFPLQLAEDDFWEENIFDLIADVYAPHPTLVTTQPQPLELTTYSPEKKFERLEKIISGTLSSAVIRSASSIQVTVASASPDQILKAVNALVSSHVTAENEQHLLQPLVLRTLEAIGCDADANMPHAHTSLLMADPVALLLLPDSLDMFKEIGARDSIRLALQYDAKHHTTHATDAFAIYQRERKWLAAFPCFDFSLEDHAAKFGIPTECIEKIFDPALFKARLPITPQGDVLKQLQNKYGFYTQDNQLPTFANILDAISSRTFVRSGNMAAIAQWIINCCDRWRYCLCEIEPDTTVRTVNQSNQNLLKKGLTGLSNMFKKV